MKKIGKWYLPDNEMHFVEQLKEKIEAVDKRASNHD